MPTAANTSPISEGKKICVGALALYYVYKYKIKIEQLMIPFLTLQSFINGFTLCASRIQAPNPDQKEDTGSTQPFNSFRALLVGNKTCFYSNHFNMPLKFLTVPLPQ
jgi:hypothetical protein